jgi:Holliday junction resolvasome RuvABC endonuclease subunit
MDSIVVLGLDPSTDVLGAALVEVTPTGCRFLAWAALHPSLTPADRKHGSLTEQVARIRSLRAGLAVWVSYVEPAFDAVAFEQPAGLSADRRGGKSFETSRALDRATGALLALSHFAESPLVAVAVNSAKAVYGHANAKRSVAKAAAMDWAHGTHPEGFCPFAGTDELEAIADACAVAVAGGRRLLAEQRAKAAKTKPLFGPGSRGPCAAKEKAAA